MTKENESQKTEYKANTTWQHVLNDMLLSGEAGKLGGSALLIYLLIKAHTNFKDGGAFPSIELLAEKANLSDRQVMRCIDVLEKAGYILKSKSGKHNVYTLREKVIIKDTDGNQQAIATWDYVPDAMQLATREVQRAVILGNLTGGKIIHIEKLYLNVSTDQSAQININSEIFKTLPDDMKEKLLSLRDAIQK